MVLHALSQSLAVSQRLVYFNSRVGQCSFSCSRNNSCCYSLWQGCDDQLIRTPFSDAIVL
jgi:hypothetical protein